MRTYLPHAPLGLVLGLVLTGCPPPEGEERLPPAHIEDGGGLPPKIGGSMGGEGPEGIGGQANTAGGPGSGGQQRTTTLRVREIDQVQGFNTEGASFVNFGIHSGTALVTAQGRNQEYPSVLVGAQEEVVLEDVLEAPDLWVRVTPRAESFMGVLTQVDTTDGDDETGLYVIPRSLMDEAIANAVTNVELEPEAAQIIVRVIDSGGFGVPGATITKSGFEVIYNAGTVWSSTETETDASGMAMIVNVFADRVDGFAQSFTVMAVNPTRVIDVDVYPDTVTLVEVLAD